MPSLRSPTLLPKLLLPLLLPLVPHAAMADSEDPRVRLAQLQLAGDQEALLEHTTEVLREQPRLAQQIGIPYLQGHLLSQAGRPRDAARAFTAARDFAPVLTPYSRYRIAHLERSQQHPEVAAGLVAGLLGSDPPSTLVPLALPLLQETLLQGGDCRVVHALEGKGFSARHRRHLQLIRAWCALRLGQSQNGFDLLLDLLRESKGDDVAREAALTLSQLMPQQDLEAEIPMLVGLTFYQHRDFRPAVSTLRQVLGQKDQLSARQVYEIRYAIARSYFWLGHYAQAADHFGKLAEGTTRAELRAQSRYQQARCFELLNNWQDASNAFRTTYNDEPNGEWAGAALLSALRLEWRAGQEETALELYDLLKQRPRARRMASLAGLFLASSDLVRGRADRAGQWLQDVAARSRDEAELSYWRGRLYELRDDPQRAVEAYLRSQADAPFHPLALAAQERLSQEQLAPFALQEGRRLAGRTNTTDLYRASLLLAGNPDEGIAAERLKQALLQDGRTAAYLQMRDVPVQEWPLWNSPLRRPGEMLLALGLWREGASAIPRHFPVRRPELALTGAMLLRRGGQLRRSLLHAETLNEGIPSYIPAQMLPLEFRRALFPNAYGDLIEQRSGEAGIDPNLLSAIIREESRFQADALSGAAARGLTQFILPTARRIARDSGMGRIAPDALYDPGIAIHLGAAYLAELLGQFKGQPHHAVAAYNAGVPQTRLWIGYCFSDDPAEFITKVSFRETRNYVRKVMTSLAQYRDLADHEAQLEPRPAAASATAQPSQARIRPVTASIPGTNPSNPP